MPFEANSVGLGPEALAEQLLRKPTLEAFDVLRVFDLLPRNPSKRDAFHHRSFGCGAWVFGSQIGIRTDTKSFPKSSALFCRYVHQVNPHHTFSSLVLLDDVHSPLHVDCNNDRSSWNLVIPLTRFRKGHIWEECEGVADRFEDASGTFWGRLHDVSAGPVLLHAAVDRHAVLPWEGRRVVLIAFTPRDSPKLPLADRDWLGDIGFRLPSSSALPTPGPPKLFLEVFSGSATLARAAQRLGFTAVAVDNCPRRPQVPTVRLDLASDMGRDALFRLLHDKKPAAVHLGPPCGTSSRARERPLPAKLRALGLRDPRPLRSADFPLNLPHIDPASPDGLRLAAANRLYDLVFHVLLWCAEHDCVFTLENPTNSWFWSVLALKVRMHASPKVRRWFSDLHEIIFDACEHGGARPKSTKLLSNRAAFGSLRARCSGRHVHEPWGVSWRAGGWVWSTHLEAQYPVVLAARWAACFASACNVSPGQPEAPDPRLQSLSAVGRQTRKHKPLVSEYKFVRIMPRGKIPSSGCKVLGAPPVQGGDSGEVAEALPETSPDSEGLGLDRGEDCQVGFYRDPCEWFQAAKKVCHPLDSENKLPKELKASLEANMVADRRALFLRRKLALMKAEILSKKLEQDESKLHSAMPSWMQTVMQGKRILLLESLLRQRNFDDMEAIELLKSGVKLSGVSECPAAFDVKVKPATSTEAELRQVAPLKRAALLLENRASDPELERDLLKVTMDEAKAGWLQGPFSSETEVSEHLGRTDWSLMRRFGVRQGGKLRPIDDACDSDLNCTFTSTMKLQLQDGDFCISLAMEIAKRVMGKPGVVPREWSGRCLDLSGAYKQMAVCEQHRSLCVLLLRDADGRPIFFISSALVFGASASVYAFLRIARALSFLLNVVLEIPHANFFDDYPILVPSEDAEQVGLLCTKFLHLLGWKHAEIGEGHKGLPFAKSFDVLGLHLDISCISSGTLTVANKLGRVDRLLERLREIKQSAVLSRHEGQVLLGLLRYAAGFFGGRTLRYVCEDLNAIVHHGHHPSPVAVRLLCQRAITALESSRPLQLKADMPSSPVHLFTDGSWEKGVAGVGAVLFDAHDGSAEVFGGEMPKDMVESLLQTDGDHLIGQIETYAVVAMRIHLAHRLSGRRVIIWTDNEGCRFGLIKGRSKSHTMDTLIRSFAAAEDADPSHTWICRVPSYSNIADGPSRGKPEEALKISGAVACQSFPWIRQAFETT